VTNVVDLFGCQVKLGFSPTVLECVSASLPPNHIFAGKVYSSPAPVIDNTAGTVVVMVILMGVQPGVNVTKGVFCQITFKNKIRGVSNLTFLELNTRTYMIDSKGTKISFTAHNGYFSNKLPTPAAKLLTNPARIVNPLLTPCNNFTMNVTISEATDLQKWQLSISYKNDVLNVTDALEGPFLQTGGSTIFNFKIENNFNETHGRVIANCTLSSSPGIGGNGTLVSFVFHVIGLGNTTISLSDIYLFDSVGDPIPYTKSDGYFNNLLVAKLNVIPEEVVGPQWLPQTNFTITIAVDDVENLYGYEFKLRYDGTVLTCFGIIIHAPLDETHYTTNFSVNNTAGEVWVRTQFYSPAVPITTYTNVSLITLFFRVRKVGVSELHLFDTYITDFNGEPIAHEVTHGYFATLIVDIAITDVVAYPSKVYQRWIVLINITVSNNGNLTETFNVKAYYDNNLIGTSVVTNLAPQETRTLTVAWNTTDVTPYYAYNYTIKAEVPPLLYELNTSDNILVDGKVIVKLMGDVNGDGIVELMDFSIVTDAYGSYPGHPRWNPDCDFNQDGIVEMMDFLILSNNYAKSYPPHP
jgi:hypothetical protein